MSATMPLLITAQDLIDRMGLDSGVTGLVPEVEKAIVRAQVYVQEQLQSKIAKTDWTAYYHLDTDAFSGLQPGGVFRIELPSAFVLASPAITVQASVETTDSEVAGIFGSFEAVASTYYKLDAKPGYLLVDPSYGDRFLKITCTSGYQEGDTFPTELKEAIFGYAPTILDAEATKDRSSESASKFQLANTFILTMLRSYMRNRGFSFRPVFVEES
jgi:hypothetical protein